LSKDLTLVGVLHVHISEKLQPQSFKLVCVVLKQVEIVTDCRQDFVEVLLEITAVLFDLRLFDNGDTSSWVISLLSTCTLVCRVLHTLRIGYFLDRLLDFDFFDQVVFFGIFLKLVANCPNDILNLCLEQVRECLNIDNRLFSIGLLDLLLLVENVDNLSVMVSVLLGPLPIVKVDQHVRQKLVQSILNRVCRLLCLCPLLRLLLLLWLLVVVLLRLL